MTEEAAEMHGHLTRRTFTVDEFQKMASTEIFRDERVELVQGEVVTMSPKGTRHAACVARLTQQFAKRAGVHFSVRVQDPLHLSDITAVEPDITVVRPRNDFYAEKHPTAVDTLLVIEVADSSLAYDRDVKLPLYARSGIRAVWLVDLIHDVIGVHTSPGESGYQRVEHKRGQEEIEVAFEPRFRVTAAAILG